MNTAMIQCQSLSHFYNAKAALSKVSFELETGEPIGLVGPNGAGKTTLLNILCGFLKPSSGLVKLFGYSPGDTELIGKVSALPQDSKLDPDFSVTQQLEFYARLQGFDTRHAKNEAIRVMDAVDLGASLSAKPHTLSHGMVKRVLIAQALIGNPQLILLDEPTAGLDPLNTRNIRTVIQEQSQRTTFIISSHNLEELDRLCRRVLLLDKGVMKQELTDSRNHSDLTLFLTLQMEACPVMEVTHQLQQIKGVVKVTNSQKNEFIIEYNQQIEPRMDQQIINRLAENHWEYRQLIKGKSLEEKLFFDAG